MKKNILFIIPANMGGGAEKVVLRLSFALKDKYNVIVAFARKNTNKAVFPVKTYELWPRSFLKDVFFIRNIIELFRLKKIKEKEKIDLSISCTEVEDIVNVLTAGTEKIFFIIENMLSKGKRLTKTVYKIFSKKIFGRANKIICCSKLVKQDAMNNFNGVDEKMVVIYNFCDVEKIIHKKAETVEQENIFKRPIVICSGRFEDQKGFLYAIKMLSKVKKHIPNSAFVFLGKGSLKKDLIKMAKYMNLKVCDMSAPGEYQENFDVYLLGFQENPYKFISKAKLFLLTSFYEGLPCVVLEAMICKTPVLCSDCSAGPREILAPNTPFLKKTDVVEKTEYGTLLPVWEKGQLYTKKFTNVDNIWAKEIVKNLKDENYRTEKIEQAFKRANDFSQEKILKQWIENIEKVLA